MQESRSYGSLRGDSDAPIISFCHAQRDVGIGVLSKRNLRLELDAGELVVLDVVGFPLRRRWYVSHREGKRLSRAAQVFLQYLQEEGEDEVAHLLATDQGESA